MRNADSPREIGEENKRALERVQPRGGLVAFVIRHIMRVMDEEAVALYNHSMNTLGFLGLAIVNHDFIHIPQMAQQPKATVETSRSELPRLPYCMGEPSCLAVASACGRRTR